MLQLIGESGVGKSHLLKDMASDKNYKIFHELSDFKKWATDSSEKQKILFIDEANIEDLHLTIFEPLKNGYPCEILYKGKCYTLNETHKVVFARNPHSYGGGRSAQKLFADNSIPEIYFEDFSDAYIYEKIIKPIFTLNFPNWNETDYHVFAEATLSVYNKKRYDENIDITVRELQEFVLKQCDTLHLLAQKKSIPENTSTKKQKTNKQFLVTGQNKPILEVIYNFIRIRKQQKTLYQSLQCVGLTGLLIEGKPGTGKSEAIQYALKELDYHIRTSLYEPKKEKKWNQKICYKIDASLSRDDQETLMIDAFENGHAVFIDELNACLDDGLEKILNAILTGVHPYTKKPSNHPGFMAFFTANSAGLAGRSTISPALRHRCTQLAMPDFKSEDLLTMFKDKFSAKDILKKVEDFLTLQEDGVDLRSYLDEYEDKLLPQNGEILSKLGTFGDSGREYISRKMPQALFLNQTHK